MALKQPAKQIRTDPNPVYPEKAADNNQYTCARTGYTKMPWWSVDFSGLAEIFSVNILNGMCFIVVIVEM